MQLLFVNFARCIKNYAIASFISIHETYLGFYVINNQKVIVEIKEDGLDIYFIYLLVKFICRLSCHGATLGGLQK